ARFSRDWSSDVCSSDLAGDGERLADVVALGERDHRRGRPALVLEHAEPPREELHLRDVGEHLRELRLDELHRAERVAELLALGRSEERRVRAEWTARGA